MVSKTCKIHGELAEKDIQAYTDHRRPGIHYRCKICRTEQDRRRNRSAEKNKAIDKLLKTMGRKKLNIKKEYLDDRVIEGKRAQVKITKTLIENKLERAK